MDNQPGGTEGDNLMKTKLATGEMADVFHYNSGSLFQALNPDQNLVPLTDEPWVAELTEDFKAVVSTDRTAPTAPRGTTQAGGVHLQQEGLREPRPGGADDLVGVRGQRREDQGRRQGHAAPADLRRHLDLTAVRARRLRQRRGAGPGVGHRVHRQQAEVRRPAGAAELRQPGRSCTRPATSTRTSPRRVRRRTQGDRHRGGRALPDADQRHLDDRAEQPGQCR